jgi:xanthine dehydrogenase small subunit
MTSGLRFLLNGEDIAVDQAAPSDTLLDFLRLERGLKGAKEGCAEGDCGACTVLVGRLHEGRLLYEPINACIRLLASCHGRHVVTIEHLRGADGGAHPIQRAMVDHHGAQCGFCTPGIVMALYALWMNDPNPGETAIETTLQGNLCRCTGYAPIVRAARAAAEMGGQARDALTIERDKVVAALSSWAGTRAQVERDGAVAYVPADVDDFAERYAEEPGATLVAGATDVGLWVTKGLRRISPAIFIDHLMKEIETNADAIRIGAGVTYSEFQPIARALLPELSTYLDRIGGWQVRSAGTIGGNVANGSPIGDMPPILIALGARLGLRRGATRREIALEDFFVDYGKQDRAPGEFVERLLIPRANGARVAAYKVSKRADADISAVSAGFSIREDGGRIATARLAFGGMAGTPRRARSAEAALTGAPFAAASFEAASHALAEDFTPLDDWRATAAYRRLVAQNLLRRFWLEQSGAHNVRLARAAGG